MSTSPSQALAPSAAAKLKACHVPRVGEEVLCGRYEVYENRAARQGRKIGLNIVVLPAKGPQPFADPLVFLAGGGVAPATSYAGFLDRAYPNLRRQRDILLVDQRGTGGSNPLDCDLSADPTSLYRRDEKRYLAGVRRCREKLEQKADLHDYTTPFAMDDLDEVRGWLGYDRLNLFGASYGTSAAMTYMRQHADRVRTVALQGVIPFDEPMWLEAPRSSQEALDRVFATCAAQPACHQAFPQLAGEFASLMRDLAAKPVKVKIKGETGREVEVALDDLVLGEFVVRALYSAASIHDLPLLIHLAAHGELHPLAAKAAPRVDPSIPKGVYLSIVCSEFIPQFDAAALPAAAAGTFMGSTRIAKDVAACREWVRGELPAAFSTPVRSEAPVLIMNGALDHVTPPRYGQRVARSLANALVLVLPQRGHNDTDECTNSIIEAFIIAGGAKGLDTSCLAKTESLTFALRSSELAKDDD